MEKQRVAEGELERGRAAYERRAWKDAYESLARADGAGLLGAGDLAGSRRAFPSSTRPW
jgi:hypothetical protein